MKKRNGIVTVPGLDPTVIEVITRGRVRRRNFFEPGQSLNAAERADMKKRGVICGAEDLIHGRVFAVCVLPPKHDEKTRHRFTATTEERARLSK